MLWRARASGSPVPRSSAAPRSASNSRDRETAIWISEAAIGARIATASTTSGLPPAPVAAAEHRRVHRDLRHERDRRGDRGGDRADQDVTVLHVHQLVGHHALDLVSGQRLQQTLGGAHDRVLGPPTRCERIGLGVRRDRHGGHRHVGSHRQTLDHVVELGRLLAGDHPGLGRSERELVAEPVRPADHHQRQHETDRERCRAAAAQDAGDGDDQRAHSSQEHGGLHRVLEHRATQDTEARIGTVRT